MYNLSYVQSSKLKIKNVYNPRIQVTPLSTEKEGDVEED